MKTNYSNLLPEISLKLKKGKIEKITICNSSDCANLFRKIWDKDSLPIYESFIVIFLDRQNKSIGWLKISQGGITGTVTDIRLIFSAALKCLATGLLIAHNHPSGNLKYSEADNAITQKIKEAGKILDINLIDHIILTEENYFSFADNSNI
jgi:DNA repair protein RadC